MLLYSFTEIDRKQFLNNPLWQRGWIHQRVKELCCLRSVDLSGSNVHAVEQFVCTSFLTNDASSLEDQFDPSGTDAAD